MARQPLAFASHALTLQVIPFSPFLPTSLHRGFMVGLGFDALRV